MTIAIITIRVLDLLTTYFNFQKYGGTAVEANSVTRYFVNTMGYPLFFMGNFFIGCTLLIFLSRFARSTRFAVLLFLIGNSIVIGINTVALAL